MRTQAGRQITPQRKIIETGKRLGNRGLAKQQGTTRILYDTLPIDGRNVFEFFKNSQNRAIPFSNTGSYGNKLEVGEAMVVERAYLSVITFDAILTDEVATFAPIESLPALTGGEMSLIIANNVVIKPLPVLSTVSYYNKSAQWGGDSNDYGYASFEFDTQLTIQPLLEYIWRLEYLSLAEIESTFLRFTIEGTGSIYAPRTTL
jgi:hypothetical protein